MKLATVFLSFISMHVTMAQHTIPLYPGEVPNSKPAPDVERTEVNNGVTIIHAITKPTLTIHLAEKTKANGTAVIIFPGGGYWVNAIEHEGHAVARQFNEQGIAAFVVKYRIPNDATMPNRERGPWQDAQQAIKVVRARASEWNINPKRVGVMGFSAGGHLAATVSTHHAEAVIPNPEKVNLRPDFSIFIYPVISFVDGVGHMGSREQIIGKNPTQEKINFYSNELQVNAQTPPAILIHASNDEAVPVEGAIRYYQGLQRHQVPAELHIYQSGGHGFGLNNPTTADRWFDRCLHWMRANKWL
jgi:acetyl esterase/lipase